MSRPLRRAALTAFATILAVSLVVDSRAGPGRARVRAALPAAGATTRSGSLTPIGPVPTTPTSAPPPATPIGPAPAESATVPATASTTQPRATTTTSRPPATAPPPPPTTRPTTARPVAPSTVPPQTTATTTRPTTTTGAPPATTTTTTGATTTTGPTTTTTAPPGTQTVDGPVVQTRYGPVQVRLTLQGHRIVDVTNLQLPNHAARSQQINNRAGPILRQEVLDAQSAQIDTVSGATTTSDAYIQCVQAILDQAWR